MRCPPANIPPASERDPRIIPSARFVGEPIGLAEHALPVSEQPGECVAAKLAKGYPIVLLENHDVVAAGESRFQECDWAIGVRVRLPHRGPHT